MPQSRKRRRKNEIRDSIESEEDSSDGGYMNTRETHSDTRGRLFSINVSPQKKTTHRTWAARRAWDPPEDLEYGLDHEPDVYHQALDATVYEAPPVVGVSKGAAHKQRRTLRAVSQFNLIDHPNDTIVDFKPAAASPSTVAKGVSTGLFR